MAAVFGSEIAGDSDGSEADAFAGDATKSAGGEEARERGFAHHDGIGEEHVLPGQGCGEFGIGRGAAIGVVEGADFLADVATGGPGTLRRPHFARRIASAFDVPRGETAGGIEDAGFDEGLCGAGIETTTTRAAVIGDWRVRLKRDVDDQFAKQEVGAETGMDQAGVFSKPADAGVRGPCAFKNGAGVGVAARVRADFFADEQAAEFFEAAFEDVMVVAASRVAGDVRGEVFARRAGGFGIVKGGEGNDRRGPWQTKSDVFAQVAAFGQITERTEEAGVEPALIGVEAGGAVGVGDAGNAREREAEVARESAENMFGRVRLR